MDKEAIGLSIVIETSTKETALNLGEGGSPMQSVKLCCESRKEATSPMPFYIKITSKNCNIENTSSAGSNYAIVIVIDYSKIV